MEKGDKMKKTITIILSVLMAFLFVACGNSEANQTQDVQNSESGQFDFQSELPLQSKLLFGSLMLEETDLAITSKQAEELLPFWKLTKTLVESDTAASAEIDAVMASIQDEMTADQLAYIEELQFGGEEMSQLMADLDIDFGFGGSEKFSGNSPPGGLGGEVPGQGPGGGQGRGQGSGGFQNLSPEQQATAQALREERGGGGRGFFGNPAIFEALIERLERK
jgi:hypothetical protein